ncbi:MAG TPA: DUF2834 domain-containing protein [Woeseiaceae bacterium]|nr:DUF2834 domain-containing protein [Woeseiaceae bacterium]
MKHDRALALALLIPFALITLYAVWEVGYTGIFAHALDGPAGWQLSADLVVALLMILVWLVADARRIGRNPWPWVLLTLFLGAFGPLFYLLTGNGEYRAAADE